MNRRLLIISFVVFIFALYVNMKTFQKVIPLKKPLESFPVHWNGWTGSDYYFDKYILEKLNASEYIMREYEKGTDKVTLYIGYYGSQEQDAQIHSPKHCLPGSGWYKISEKQRTLNIKNAGDVRFVEAVYQKGDQKEMFYYWYKMKNAYITNEYVLKLVMITHSLKYGRNDAAFLRISSVLKGDMSNTIHSIDGFMMDFLPLLKDYLPE